MLRPSEENHAHTRVVDGALGMDMLFGYANSACGVFEKRKVGREVVKVLGGPFGERCHRLLVVSSTSLTGLYSDHTWKSNTECYCRASVVAEDLKVPRCALRNLDEAFRRPFYLVGPLQDAHSGSSSNASW